MILGFGGKLVKQEKLTRFIPTKSVDKKWFLVDAKDQTLGRLATKIARIIIGKNKPIFTPNSDTGDFVIVINAKQVRVTGKREQLKNYTRHSGYPGGQKITSYQEMLANKPEFIIQNAVKKMLPKNRLGNKMIKKLKVYADDKHPHASQKPEILV
ncbi:MAG: 50S ribosomal protein L13 [Ignavibacteriaceae bacterium]|nr:50S ribosomal protein L13 [Ignavibacteriaceae bacterium]